MCRELKIFSQQNLGVCCSRSQLKLNSFELNKKDIYANYFTILNSNRSSSPEFCRLMSAKGFSNVTIGERPSCHWRCGARVCPSRSVVIGARCRQRVEQRQSRARFLFFLFCFVLLSCGGAVLMACAPCSALCARWVLCARLDAVCAAQRCARLGAVCAARALLCIFFVHSDTRMYFFTLQIAAYCCWLVAVSAQALNKADAAALNQTLTGLGCWQSSTCQTQNFNCSISGAVQCNANGSVTSL